MAQDHLRWPNHPIYNLPPGVQFVKGSGGHCDRNVIQRFRLSAARQPSTQTGENAANGALSKRPRGSEAQDGMTRTVPLTRSESGGILNRRIIGSLQRQGSTEVGRPPRRLSSRLALCSSAWRSRQTQMNAGGHCNKNVIQRFRLSVARQLSMQTGENAANGALSQQARMLLSLADRRT